jgi:hypothetical protein
MFNKIIFLKNQYFFLLNIFCLTCISSEYTITPYRDLSAYKAFLYKKFEKHCKKSDNEYFPKDIIMIVLNYCEEMHLTGFTYKNLRFNLLLPAETYANGMYMAPIVHSHIEIGKQNLKKHILESLGFRRCKPKTIDLSGYKYQSKLGIRKPRTMNLYGVKCKDKDDNSTLYIKSLTIDQFLRKNNDFVDLIYADDADAENFPVQEERLYIDRIFELNFLTNSPSTLRELCETIQRIYPSINVKKLMFACSDCGGDIPSSQPLNMLGCAYINPIRFRNGCQKLSRPIIATSPLLAKSAPTSTTHPR